LVDAIVDMGERNGGYLVRLYAYVPAATYAFAAGERSLACRMVGRARRLARAGDSRVMEFAICVVAAYFAFRDGRRKRALAYLRRVLEIGEVERYLAFPWMRPHMLSSLCGLALAELGPSEYLAQLIAARNIAPPAEAELRRNWPWPCRISVLGPFAVSVDGTPAAFGRKANRRLMVLLQALVLAGPEGAAQEQLIDRIWGESNGTSGAYRAALHRLRALLGSENAVLVTDGRVRLKPDHCWVDAWELEASAVDGADPALFRGPPMLAHLGSYEAAIWAERMRALHARAVEARAVALGAAEDWPAMLAAYRDALAVNPLAEAFYRGKMQAHAALAEPAEISRTLEECRQALAGELDVAISAKTEALAERLLIVPNP
jgi:hypothetical protein